MSVGTHTISVAYSGDSVFSSGTQQISYVVSADTTTTTIAPSANPGGTGQLVSFTATVANNIVPGGGTPTGSVTFTVNGTTEQTVTLNAQGQAVYSGVFNACRHLRDRRPVISLNSSTHSRQQRHDDQ